MHFFVSLLDVGMFQVWNVLDNWSVIWSIPMRSHKERILMTKCTIWKPEHIIQVPRLTVYTRLIKQNLATFLVRFHLFLNPDQCFMWGQITASWDQIGPCRILQGTYTRLEQKLEPVRGIRYGFVVSDDISQGILRLIATCWELSDWLVLYEFSTCLTRFQ